MASGHILQDQIGKTNTMYTGSISQGITAQVAAPKYAYPKSCAW